MARRREAPAEEVPDRERFRVADWTDLPLEPPVWFVERYRLQVGTKESLVTEWFMYRAINARRRFSQAKRQVL